MYFEGSGYVRASVRVRVGLGLGVTVRVRLKVKVGQRVWFQVSLCSCWELGLDVWLRYCLRQGWDRFRIRVWVGVAARV